MASIEPLMPVQVAVLTLLTIKSSPTFIVFTAPMSSEVVVPVVFLITIVVMFTAFFPLLLTATVMLWFVPALQLPEQLYVVFFMNRSANWHPSCSLVVFCIFLVSSRESVLSQPDTMVDITTTIKTSSAALRKLETPFLE